MSYLTTLSLSHLSELGQDMPAFYIELILQSSKLLSLPFFFSSTLAALLLCFMQVHSVSYLLTLCTMLWMTVASFTHIK